MRRTVKLTLICLASMSRLQGMDLPVEQTRLMAMNNLIRSSLHAVGFEKADEVPADVDVRDSLGNTALLFIARHLTFNQFTASLTKQLDELGANINFVHKKDRLTPLLAALTAGPRRKKPDKDLATLLVKLGADVNRARADGITPLMLAGNYNFEGLVQMLLQPKADVLARSHTGHSAYHYASNNSRALLATFINARSQKPRPDYQGTVGAAESSADKPSKRPSLSQRIKEICEKHAQNPVYPLLAELKRGCPDMSYVELWSWLDEDQEDRALIDLLKWQGYERWDKVADYTTEITDSHGDTPLLFIARNIIGCIPVALCVSVLRFMKADFNCVNKHDGATPLIAALSKTGRRKAADEVIIQVLLNGRADVNKARTTDGVTPLMLAAADDSLHEIVKLFLSRGARVDARDLHGKSVLDYATKKNGELFREFLP